jgi:hypothetical protein
VKAVLIVSFFSHRSIVHYEFTPKDQSIIYDFDVAALRSAECGMKKAS